MNIFPLKFNSRVSEREEMVRLSLECYFYVRFTDNGSSTYCAKLPSLISLIGHTLWRLRQWLLERSANLQTHSHEQKFILDQLTGNRMKAYFLYDKITFTIIDSITNCIMLRIKRKKIRELEP